MLSSGLSLPLEPQLRVPFIIREIPPVYPICRGGYGQLETSGRLATDHDLQFFTRLHGEGVEVGDDAFFDQGPVSYTHLTLPTNREV